MKKKKYIKKKFKRIMILIHCMPMKTFGRKKVRTSGVARSEVCVRLLPGFMPACQELSSALSA